MSKNSKEKNVHDESSEAVSDLDEAADELVEELSTDSSDAENTTEVMSDDSVEELPREVLVDQLAAANEQIDEMKEGYIRAKAEVANIQRRSQNEIVSARKFAIEGFARELLTVVDSLDQASRVEMDESGGEAVVKMKEGLELTLKQFGKVMEKFGVTEVEADSGIKFNPDLHQAISVVPSDEVEPDYILSVMQKGFTLKDRLLRPAMVVIAKNDEN